jgi:hypothetical protein
VQHLERNRVLPAVALIGLLSGAISLTACTNDQVSMATQAIGVYNATRAVDVGAVGDVAGNLGVATPTSSQARHVASLMTTNTGNPAANMALPEAASSITPFLLAVSCAKTTGNPPPLSARYIASNASGQFTGAINGMSRHPTDRCTDVTQLTGWSRSGNTLNFTATFRSAQSGEQQQRRYQMARQSTGQWLFSAGN